MAEIIETLRRKARADGQRNRALLLEAAKRVLNEKGAAVSLNEIAQAAGVGNGTLYRHFPTRAALVAAVCQEDARELINAATHLAATRAPLEALSAWMNAFIGCIATKQIVAEATTALLSTSLDSTNSSCVDVGAALTMLFDRAVAEGQIRGDVDPLDLVRAVTGVATINSHPDWKNNARRLIGVIIAGLRQNSST
ncbi:TetR/AcrR family transcriptional regulator [Devosia sp. 1635]|uniref:TetR/AcrR family transcriptional regulator n=1 Tax=Devosia sp. 1635 TaxID=2726066 RepID=UPI0015632FC2|nr:TetR/AcrR family transcriptional regulator [Devosia sp. 1635]